MKRDLAGGGAVHQALRYCEKAARFDYDKLHEMFQTYNDRKDVDLKEAHRKFHPREQQQRRKEAQSP